MKLKSSVTKFWKAISKKPNIKNRPPNVDAVNMAELKRERRREKRLAEKNNAHK